MPELSIVAQVLVALAYGVLAWIDRPAAARFATAPVNADVAPRPANAVLARVLAIIVVVHGFVLWHLLFQPQGVNLSFAVSLSLIGMLLAIALVVSVRLMPLPGLASRTLPLVAAAALLPAILRAPHWLPYSTDFIATAHLVVALLAFALFVIAAVQAAAMLSLEQQLHRGPVLASGAMPPVLTLERWLFTLIGIGFLLLTAALASGMVFSEELFGKPARFNHKVVFSVLAWLLFGILLVGRWRFGWRGRRALRWVVTGSVLLLIGYAGSKFVLEIVLGRS